MSIAAEALWGRRDPDERGYFGAYGGRFVPETLVAPIEALTVEYIRARADEGFRREVARLLREYVGRPTPLFEARRLSAKAGGRSSSSGRIWPHRRASAAATAASCEDGKTRVAGPARAAARDGSLRVPLRDLPWARKDAAPGPGVDRMRAERERHAPPEDIAVAINTSWTAYARPARPPGANCAGIEKRGAAAGRPARSSPASAAATTRGIFGASRRCRGRRGGEGRSTRPPACSGATILQDARTVNRPSVRPTMRPWVPPAGGTWHQQPGLRRRGGGRCCWPFQDSAGAGIRARAGARVRSRAGADSILVNLSGRGDGVGTVGAWPRPDLGYNDAIMATDH
jgi:hypothetical protein